MFSVADVDTHEIDEKSIITYISSLYDVFPEPPPVHPLYDSVSIDDEIYVFMWKVAIKNILKVRPLIEL